MNALTMRMIGLGLFGISWLTLVVSTVVGAVDAFGAPAPPQSRRPPPETRKVTQHNSDNREVC